MEHIPWVEKYRPTTFNDIVLDSTNRRILGNILAQNYFPNLLFYGPPGTGKTTTIINLVNAYQSKYGKRKKVYSIHLNASDDRGIDIIRNQISQFVNTKTLFSSGLKFVILDEVDYMTKNAQQALRYLIQQYSRDVRFCLICNYISRIERALQNEFVRLRFCQLPQKDIYNFLDTIQKTESLKIPKEQLKAVQFMFKSDIRSMINFIQSNHTSLSSGVDPGVITNEVWEKLISVIKTSKSEKEVEKYITCQSRCHRVGATRFISGFVDYLIKYKPYSLAHPWMDSFRYIIHSEGTRESYIVNYSSIKLRDLYKVV
jgi:replication factor C subunit 3/5